MSLLAELSTPLSPFIPFMGTGRIQELSKNEYTYRRPDDLRASPQDPSFLGSGLGAGVGVGVAVEALGREPEGVTCFQEKHALHTGQSPGFSASACRLSPGWTPDAGNSCTLCM